MVSYISGESKPYQQWHFCDTNVYTWQARSHFSLSMGKTGLVFWPLTWFSLSGKTGIYFWRYQVLNKGKFRMSTGITFGIAYSSTLPGKRDSNRRSNRANVTSLRESIARLLLSKYISIGMYYMYAHGIDPETTKHAFPLRSTAVFRI